MACNIAIPAIVKFAFKDFQLFNVAEKAKWKAKCCHCNEKITESRNTTTGFNK